MDADEVHLHAAVRGRARGVRPQLRDEVDRPRVVPVERALLDMVARELVGRVVVERPLKDVRVERNGCTNTIQLVISLRSEWESYADMSR